MSEGAIVGGYPVHLEAAHTISRDLQDREVAGPRGGVTLVVDYHSTIPLCGSCHRDFHEHLIDLLPYLTREEEQDVVKAVGLESAYRRLTGSRG